MSRSILWVQGITCLDCASHFEQAVKQLPGISSAKLNPITGKLELEGEFDWVDLQRLAREENYTIVVWKPSLDRNAPRVKLSNEAMRAIVSGVAVFMAYVFEGVGFSGGLVLSFYYIAIGFGGWSNFRKSIVAASSRKLNMSVLMSLAVLGSLVIEKHEEGAMVAFLYAVSEVLESWSLEKTRRSVSALMEDVPLTCKVFRDETEVEMPVEQVDVGERMLVEPGQRIALDGIVRQGRSSVNQAAITGESMPVSKNPGDAVFAGAINSAGVLEVEVTKRFAETTLARIIHQVAEAQATKAPAQKFVEWFAERYTPMVLLLSVAFMLVPLVIAGEDWHSWFYRGLTLLVLACPCALVVSTPVALVCALSNAAKKGVLIKGGLHLEQLGGIKAIAFDKTGTLTLGEPVVTEIVSFSSKSKEEILSLAASLERYSNHPFARAIMKSVQKANLSIPVVAEFSVLPGLGNQGIVDGQLMYIGNVQLFEDMGWDVETAGKRVHTVRQKGQTPVLIGSDNQLIGLLAVADEIRPAAAPVVGALKRLGVERTIMLTGDHETVAAAIATQVGVEEYQWGLLPEEKLGQVEQWLEKYGSVAMVGDGINDAPALARASIGIAMGAAGSDTAMETADVVLMSDKLELLPYAVRLSRKTLGIIKFNVFFSIGIKLLAVLLVVPGWLTLWMAIFADMGATLLVTANSMRLLTFSEDGSESVKG